MRLGNDTIAIYEPKTTTDPDGSEFPAFELIDANADLVATVHYCNVQPFLMSEKLQFEDNNDRTAASTTYRVFAPAGTVVNYDQWVKFDGIMYEAFGFAGPWRLATGNAHHVEFLIRRREG